MVLLFFTGSVPRTRAYLRTRTSAYTSSAPMQQPLAGLGWKRKRKRNNKTFLFLLSEKARSRKTLPPRGRPSVPSLACSSCVFVSVPSLLLLLLLMLDWTLTVLLLPFDFLKARRRRFLQLLLKSLTPGLFFDHVFYFRWRKQYSGRGGQKNCQNWLWRYA